MLSSSPLRAGKFPGQVFLPFAPGAPYLSRNSAQVPRYSPACSCQ